MSEMLEKLERYGADTKGAMERFLDDEELYKSCLEIFVKDQAFHELAAALAVPNYESAFECAHTLKGVAGNMGLYPIYEPICTMVEALRSQKYAELGATMSEIERQLDIIKEIFHAAKQTKRR